MHYEYPEDWAQQLEHDHDAYMDPLIEYAYDGEETDDDDPDAGIDATGLPYCGCDTCYRRASWTFLMGRIIEAREAGIITGPHPDKPR